MAAWRIFRLDSSFARVKHSLLNSLLNFVGIDVFSPGSNMSVRSNQVKTIVCRGIVGKYFPFDIMQDYRIRE